MHANSAESPSQEQLIQTAIAALDDILPDQAPLLDFVHFNPLRGYQHLPFNAAICQAQALTGISGYLPETHYRAKYHAGEITDNDLSFALKATPYLADLDEPVLAEPRLSHLALYKSALLYELEPVLPNQLAWQIEEMNTLERFQPDVSPASRQQFLTCQDQSKTEADLIGGLWQWLLHKLDLEQTYLHPENMLDLSLDQAESLLAQHKASQKKISLKKATMRERMQEAVTKTFADELSKLGSETTLRNVMIDLCGVDILDNVRPQIIRLCSSAMDKGLAPWPLPGREAQGMYAAWRAIAGLDINPFLQELPDWHAIIAELPSTPEAAIILQLSHFEIPPTHWAGYLRCLALEIPGWSGMINWHEQHRDVLSTQTIHPTLADYLAIRLTLDRLWINQICQDTWQIEATLSSLKNYFRKNASEYMVRSHLYRGNLPEYLIQQAETMTLSVGKEQFHRSDWQTLADIIWTWQGSSMITSRPMHSIFDSAWRLFRLFQHLGFNADQLQQVTKDALEQILSALNQFNLPCRQAVWLAADEHRAQNQLFSQLSLRQHVPISHILVTQPTLQVVFSMDNRVESLRRALELNHNQCETFGTVDFIQLASTDSIPSPHPSNFDWHLRLLNRFNRLRHHGLRINALTSPLLMLLGLPIASGALLGKIFAPRQQQLLMQTLRNDINNTTNLDNDLAHNPLTYDLDQQAEYAEAFLKTLGLTQSFSPLILLLGHSTQTINNSHKAAYSLQSAGINGSGESARVLALLLNQPAVRATLNARGINIPAETWFLSADYDANNTKLDWHAVTHLPASLKPHWQTLQQSLDHACQLAALERYKTLWPTAQNITTFTARQKLYAVGADFSKSYTASAFANANTLILGRRKATRGLPLANQAFLVSYSAEQDPNGDQLAALLAKVLPVISNINLAYYFAAVDNNQGGSGDQTLHNVIGRLGVMEGGSSDLRTGLPQQLVENHSPRRLQLLIEAQPAVISSVLIRLPAIQQLIQQAWIYLALILPETGAILTYNPQHSDFIALPSASAAELLMRPQWEPIDG